MTVNQIMKKVVSKVPGILPPYPKSEIDGKVTDLLSKTVPELKELRDRQMKLLCNKNFVSRLDDKGEKIKAFHDKIVAILKDKLEEDKTCQLLSILNLNATDKEVVQDVEWEGKIESRKDVYLDSDDDSDPEDTLHILSQSTAVEKKINVIKPEPPSITTEDLIKIGEVPHVKYLVDKTESKTIPKVLGTFKPYKTTKSDVHDPGKEIHRKKHKYWEVTAATPPPIIHGPAKLLPLEESLKLQQEYNIHLKEVEARHAAEKLLARTGIKMPDLPVDISRFGGYRDVDSEDSNQSDLEGSDKEVHDEEPERGGVVFTVMK